ncbi:hypothetical protein GQ43DRAFT_444230 [Delitschia confertaspora ATCC 74209]|uniref:Chitin-binding type-1 domain-containing protein n=1 Tax=Delitschia confertaspora ATCC 74209 TaxID=1513339 RepID=A0A9P4JIT8_9PLEO|nr:hypothetical protein GQ43DRAFT_444230 [Delitschia confertaspora ATCC 74209]
MRVSVIASALFAGVALAQNCGPQYGNQVCAAGNCCSQYGWCDTTAAHCDPANCLSKFSGAGSSCASKTLATTTKPAATPSPYASTVPNIDVCGHAEGGISCPGAGLGGYFYRCCSSAGHCGPKNDIQDQAIYCGTGCQAGYGKCDTEAKPASPTAAPGVAQDGETCGPIVNKKCATGLCCSGSNFCGTGVDFCGAANWCQAKWGKCT